jgi:hypothetical protein
MLAASVLIAGFGAPCWQGSISAYYFTAAHTVFVGSLCALGILLISYRGSKDSEDILLDLAGIMAFVVAMVPTTRPEKICGAALPEKLLVTAGITNNIWALMVALVVAKALSYVMAKKKGTPTELSLWGKRARWVFWVVIAVGAVTFLLLRPTFDEFAHATAAIVLFLAFGFVVFLNAYLVDKQDTTNKEFYQRAYRTIGWAMVATLPAVVLLHVLLTRLGEWDQTVLVLEAALIAEFAAFWAFQTVELWDARTRNELIPADVRQTLPPM